MVKSNMKQVCEEVLNTKASTSEVAVASTSNELWKREYEKWRQEDAAAREEIEKKRGEEIARLKRENEDLKRMCLGRAEGELKDLRKDNQALIHDMLILRDEVKNLKRGCKRSANAVIEKSPPKEPARGQVKATMEATVKGNSAVVEEERTAAQWEKFADTCRKMRVNKEMAERELSALKERINRIKICMSPSTRRKVFTKRRMSRSPLKGATETQGGDKVKATFVRKVGEEQDAFLKRVSNDLGKLLKAQMKILCNEEHVTYNSIKKTTNELAWIYTARVFGNTLPRWKIGEDDDDNDERDEDEEFADVVGGSGGEYVVEDSL
ncbi:hypothetical protein CBR_g49273 [Chara braunii]|uniref:Uncharacterized protein n=1 Tax=Chara braunii TaxID=69332 RepID=A0A388M4T2_CHABU|nr:hypothetical protein CBR_g49273 [Chara braunii]|eukprot:GBG89482.1 hypothetical protein CBR_g49273 [Chara braunii]